MLNKKKKIKIYYSTLFKDLKSSRYY